MTDNNTITFKRTITFTIDFKDLGDYFDVDESEDVKMRIWKKMCSMTGGKVKDIHEPDYEEGTELFEELIHDTIGDAELELKNEDSKCKENNECWKNEEFEKELHTRPCSNCGKKCIGTYSLGGDKNGNLEKLCSLCRRW